jgi:hypothetical protein
VPTRRKVTKAAARRAAMKARHKMPDRKPHAAAACPRGAGGAQVNAAPIYPRGPSTPLEHNDFYKDQRRAAASAVFPGKQRYSNCGLQAIEQIIHQAGGRAINEEVFLMNSVAQGLAQRGDGKKGPGPVDWRDVEKNPLAWGGTSQYSLQKNLANYGVPSQVVDMTSKNLKEAILGRKGVVAEVDVSELWKPTSQSGGHAINVVDGVFDKDGKLTGVVINDTGTGQQGRVVPLKDFIDAAMAHPSGAPKLVVTDNPIWP